LFEKPFRKAAEFPKTPETKMESFILFHSILPTILAIEALTPTEISPDTGD
jgi:hypothetical protein